MSIAFLAIGAAHALPPIIGAKVGRIPGVWIGAAVAAMLAASSGKPAFILVDFVGVAVGVVAGLSMVGSSPERKTS